MRDSLRLGRIAGFPVSVNWSVLVIVFLLAWGLAGAVLPQAAPGRTTGVYWLAGVVGAVLLVCSLMAHELAHAIVARRAGVEVSGLTLWMFGGVATLKGEPPTPRADFRIAAVGPATSLALGLLFGTLSWLLAALGWGGLVASVAAWLATINVVLAVFNLIPGAPLDGGRVLRAVLWARTGDRDRAAATATRAGQVVAYCLVAIGLLSFLTYDPVGGLWMILIGWFVLTAARAEQEATVADHVLHGVLVRDVMSTDLQVGSAELSVEEFIDVHVLRGRHSAYPLVDADGAVVGLVTLAQLRDVPPAARPSVSVRAVALPLPDVASCAPTEPVADLLPRVTRESGHRALVFDEGRLVGIVTPRDVQHALEARQLVSASGVGGVATR
jgi:Zn-dependent protease/CBS domain-containing protein